MIKNKYFLLIFILLIFFTLGVFFIKNSQYGGEKSFKTDINDISFINFKDINGKEIRLNKKENQWFINNFKVDDNKMAYITKIIENLQVNYPVTNKNRKVAINVLRKTSYKLSLYDEDSSEIKTIHIGNLVGNDGCYMILEKNNIVEKNPYVVNVPSLIADYRLALKTDINSWKSKELFRTQLDDIEKINVTYFDNYSKSFTLQKDEELVKIIPINDSLTIKKNINKEKVGNFLISFEKIDFEFFISNDTLQKAIISSDKLANISVKDVFGKIKSIDLYKKPSNPQSQITDVMGNPIPYDIDLLYGYIPQDKIYCTIQFYSIGPLLLDYKYFFD